MCISFYTVTLVIPMTFGTDGETTVFSIVCEEREVTDLKFCLFRLPFAGPLVKKREIRTCVSV